MMKIIRPMLAGLASFVLCVSSQAAEPGGDNPYPGASHVPDSQSGWDDDPTGADLHAPLDEAQGGVTARGTPITKRNADCFPAETRNLFADVDGVVKVPGEQPEPFDYTNGHGVIDDEGRAAIRGQNTWMLWGEGNEAFWGWLQEQGYGLVDFLVLLDSRKRAGRFESGGMINQPGMKEADSAGTLLGLHLDVADGENITLKQPSTDVDENNQLVRRPEPPPSHPTRLFEPGNSGPYRYEEVLKKLPQDGVDTSIYGYPSGVVGLRLMPNPDFFGNTPAAGRAREYWKTRVDNGTDAFYKDVSVQADPDLVRPFRVTMSCAFCHLGPHPLNPPKSVDESQWANLSSTIGNQYWTPPKLFANLTTETSLLYQFLASQQPGTVDTSLVSTDHINNANTITAVFNVNERLERAKWNAPEAQSKANLLIRGLNGQQAITPRPTPRVLIDGSDSVDVYGALSRVYLNIGTFPEEWARCHNPIIGFKPQRPFSVATLKKNSVFWNAAEPRIDFLAKFFTHRSGSTGKSIVAPMKLANAPGGAGILESDKEDAAAGRAVFIQNCAVCHSSIQPKGFELAFADDWAKQKAPDASSAVRLRLPRRFEEWEAFRTSNAFIQYGKIMANLAAQPAADGADPFIDDNFLSTDIRIPVTLVGTNSGRAVGTNAMRGQVWENFSSDDYKKLPAVGAVRFFNPYSGAGRDRWGNNDQYYPPAGGPGYYRPASLISLWATAPYLHNNALGRYTKDPSVTGRLDAFEDGIEKLLWQAKRRSGAHDVPGDLRSSDKTLAGVDPGFIYRVTKNSSITFAAKFVHPLLVGVVGKWGVRFLTLYLWIGFAVISIVLVFVARTRFAGFVLLLYAVGSAALLVVTRLDKVWPALVLVPAAATLLAAWLWLDVEKRWLARAFFVTKALVSIGIGVVLYMFANGHLGGINVGSIPRGTPINLVMNINPEAPTTNLIAAVSGMTRGLLLSRNKNEAEALRVFQSEAGLPLLGASKCPDFVLDRGHWFGEGLTDTEKQQLKAFLKTL